MKKKISKIAAVFMAATAMWALAGCEATELEETAFPLLAAVDYEEDGKKVTYCNSFSRSKQEGGEANDLPHAAKTGVDFTEAKENYESLLQKIPDYNHLKILLLGEDFIENKQAYNDMLSVLAQTEEFPRNTYICVTEDVGEVLKIVEKLPEDLGSYLENYLENHNQKQDDLLSLGDLIDEKENQSMILYAPYFEIDDGVVEMRGDYALEVYD
uniref:Ger(x)C family spore germination protein n=1 Tax=Agathobacter sp. TaxID=2021311 RepID=UPI0040560FD0